MVVGGVNSVEDTVCNERRVVYDPDALIFCLIVVL